MGGTRRGVSGRPLSGASRHHDPGLGLDHVPLLRPPHPPLTVTRQLECSLQGFPLPLRAAGSPPAAPSMAFCPPSRSSSAGVRGDAEASLVPLLGVHPASVALSLRDGRASQRGSAHDLCSLGSPCVNTVALRLGLQRLPPGQMCPTLSRQVPPPWRLRPASAAVSVARCAASGVGLASVLAMQAARSLSELPSRGFPACCLPPPLSVGAPLGVFHTLRGSSSAGVRCVTESELSVRP